MKFYIVPLLLMLFISVSTNAQFGSKPESSATIMKEALNEANQQYRKVFIIFHASWCGWCHRMDNSMNDPVCQYMFDKNFIIRHLVVDESDDKKNLENPGADAIRLQYGGGGQGIPYWLIFDKKGTLLADSKMRELSTASESGQNIGCPASEKEVAYFISILQKTTNLSASELEIIRKRFRKNEL